MSNASLELGGDNWAAKDGNLLGYAVGDSSGKYVPREFTFTRGSNLAATRVAANGLIEKGRENLLLQSNQFDTTWLKTNVSVTGGQSGYDGSNDAWLLEATNTASILYQIVSSSGVQNISVYAKAGTTDNLVFYSLTSPSVRAGFDLTNGSVNYELRNIDASIEDVGNGWYRCSMVFSGASTAVRIYPADSTLTATIGDNIYIQDAQLEQGLVATDYIETGATTVQAGLLENEPRIDYTGGTGSLLLEPSRTNLITQSEYFGGYSNSNSTDEPNATTSPEGLTNATSFLEAATTGQHKLTTSLSFDGSSTYTFSIFAKTNGRDLYIDTQNSNEWGGRAWFDLTNGTANAVLGTANIENFGNGWYRCSVTGASTLAGGNFVELLTSDGSTNSTTGDITKGVFIYGAQMEQGSYPTSYIPNHSGGSVTRGGDSAITIPSAAFEWDGLASGDSATLFIETKVTAVQNNNFNVLSQGGSGVWKWNSSTFFARTNNPATAPSFSMGVDINTLEGSTIKIAFVKDDGNLKMFYNGSSMGVVAIGTAELDWCSHISSNYQSAQGLKQFVGFNTALSDAQCSALTVEGLKEEILTSYIAAVDTLEDGAEARLDTYLQNLEELIV